MFCQTTTTHVTKCIENGEKFTHEKKRNTITKKCTIDVTKKKKTKTITKLTQVKRCYKHRVQNESKRPMDGMPMLPIAIACTPSFSTYRNIYFMNRQCFIVCVPHSKNEQIKTHRDRYTIFFCCIWKFDNNFGSSFFFAIV